MKVSTFMLQLLGYLLILHFSIGTICVSFRHKSLKNDNVSRYLKLCPCDCLFISNYPCQLCLMISRTYRKKVLSHIHRNIVLSWIHTSVQLAPITSYCVYEDLFLLFFHLFRICLLLAADVRIAQTFNFVYYLKDCFCFSYNFIIFANIMKSIEKRFN